MSPIRPEEHELSHIASVVCMLEQPGTHRATASKCIVLHPSYWIARLDDLLTSNRLLPDHRHLALSLKQRLALLVNSHACGGDGDARSGAAADES